MTDTGTHVIVDASEKGLQELLDILRTQGRSIRICVGGDAVAELTPFPNRRKLFPVDPAMKATFLTDDPVHLTSEEDWPEHRRVGPNDPGVNSRPNE